MAGPGAVLIDMDAYCKDLAHLPLEFVEPSKRYADVILPEGGKNRIGVEMILARVQREARRRGAPRAEPAPAPLSPLVPNP